MTDVLLFHSESTNAGAIAGGVGGGVVVVASSGGIIVVVVVLIKGKTKKGM